MTDSLTRLLHERTADEPVGPPPLADMHRNVVRRRRGRHAVVGAVAAMVLVAGLATALGDDGRGPEDPPVPAARSEEPPAGTRWVGSGRAVVSVPADWPTNAVGCGTPQVDTVVIDLGPVCAAFVPRPPDVESVWVWSEVGNPESTGSWTETEVDGQTVRRSPVTSSGGTFQASAYVPGEGILFEASSSSADGATRVVDLLDGIRVLRDHVTVPGFQVLTGVRDLLVAPERRRTAYLQALEEAGLRPEVRAEARPGAEPGQVLTVVPAPGSVVEPGATVVVTVAAQP